VKRGRRLLLNRVFQCCRPRESSIITSGTEHNRTADMSSDQLEWNRGSHRFVLLLQTPSHQIATAQHQAKTGSRGASARLFRDRVSLASARGAAPTVSSRLKRCRSSRSKRPPTRRSSGVCRAAKSRSSRARVPTRSTDRCSSTSATMPSTPPSSSRTGRGCRNRRSISTTSAERLEVHSRATRCSCSCRMKDCASINRRAP